MPAIDIPPRYNSKEIESKWYELWEKSGYFKPVVDETKKPFVIVIPPPNVTGILHMGHALNNTIQDILIRWKRMQGVPVLWVPGVDHAGIATQNVVEKKLAKEGKTRQQIGREKFIESVWKWKEEYGSTIVRQLRRLGSSCDWTRERFTMDEKLSRAVRESFVSLYEKDLIYRGNYIINWCPRCHTALSDEEAVHKEIQGFFYYIKYPIDPKTPVHGQDHILIATTRPETMLGDTAVAVNPNDERFKTFAGKRVILPLMNRSIPIIQDEFVDPEFGTGLVKVTPAHDPNDFAMGNRHQLEFVNILNPDGTINENGGNYRGLDRFEARKRVIEDLEKAGLFVEKKPHIHAVGHCYRCHTMVEPYLSKQWFVRMKPLAEPAIKAAQDGRIQFIPERWTKVYLNWLENIRDWCIYRQIWWGHQIPVWYCHECEKRGKVPDNLSSPNASVGDIQTCPPQIVGGSASGGDSRFRGNDSRAASINAGIIVSRQDPTQCPTCGDKNLIRDPDVLDTWFSSWLWPFSTLGWPEKTKDLQYFYPTSTLVTAPEIIFFWVARMIMAGFQFMEKEPFDTVLIHGTVRVEGGQKMSKSLGNSIDPLEIIEEMSADALRFSLMMLGATDVYLSRQKFEQGRNFTNKIWNAFRFCVNNLADFKPEDFRPLEKMYAKEFSVIDKWILTELQDAAEEIDTHLEECRLSEAANSVYHFFWHSFCDWYLELAKPVLMGNQTAERKVVQNILVHVLETSMKLLHPFMPFITEEVWQRLKELIGGEYFANETVMLARWPFADQRIRFEKEANAVRLFQEAVGGVRDLRSRLGLKPAEELNEVTIVVKNHEAEEALRTFQKEICFLNRIKHLSLFQTFEKKSGMVGKVYSHIEIFVSGLSESDLKREGEKIREKIAELEKHIQSINDRLGSEQFISRAPEEIVEKEKERKEDFEKQLESYRENLTLFG